MVAAAYCGNLFDRVDGAAASCANGGDAKEWSESVVGITIHGIAECDGVEPVAIVGWNDPEVPTPNASNSNSFGHR